MTEVTFTFRLDETLKDEFTSAAKESDRTGAQLLRDFMRDFVISRQEKAAHDAWFRREVRQGLKSANAGRLMSSRDVEKKFASLRASAGRKRVQSGK